jgi:hypothetical protein
MIKHELDHPHEIEAFIMLAPIRAGGAAPLSWRPSDVCRKSRGVNFTPELDAIVTACVPRLLRIDYIGGREG